MEFMTVKEAAAKWGLSERRLQTICNEGMVRELLNLEKRGRFRWMQKDRWIKELSPGST